MSERQPTDTNAEESKGATESRSSDEQPVSRHTCNRWGAALLMGLALAVVGGGMAFLLWKPTYEAVAWLRIEARPRYIAFESHAEDRDASKSFAQAQIELLRTPPVLCPVLNKPEIARMPEIAAESDPMSWLAKQIRINEVGDSELYRVAYAAPDPKSAATVVTALLDEYFRLCRQKENGRTQDLIKSLERELETRKQELARMRANLQELTRQISGKDLFGGAAESTVLVSQMNDVKQVSGDALQLRFKQGELERAEKVYGMIANRILELNTETGAPERVTVIQSALVPRTPIEVFPHRNIWLAAIAGFSLPFLGLLAFSAISWVVSACFPVVERRLPQTPASDS